MDSLELQPAGPSSPPHKRVKLEYESPALSDGEDVPEDLDEDHCSICLQAVVDRTVVPTCSHEFCFECLMIWTEQSRRCPLCSQNIGEHVIHNIRSKYDYQKHYLPPIRTNSPHILPLRLSGSRPYRRRTRIPREIRQRSRRERDERMEADRFDRAVERRKWIYKHDLYAKHVASNSHTRYRPYPTPSQFTASPELISRATTFLRRELLVWPNMDIEFLTTFIISLMKAIDIRSESAVKLMAEFLDLDMPYVEGRRHVNAEHFAHELYSYLRSPYKDLFVYDEVAQYDEPPADSPPPSRRNREQRISRWREPSFSPSPSPSRSRSRRHLPSLSPPPPDRTRGRENYRSRSRSRSRVRPRSRVSLSWSPSGRSYPSSRNHDIEVSHLPANLGDMEPNSGWRNDRPHVDGGSASPNLINYPSSPSPRHASPDAYRYSRRSHHAVPPAPSSGQLSIKGRGKRKAGAAAVGVPETSRPRGRSDSRGSEEHPEVSDEMNGALATITYPHERPASEINEFNHPATVPSDTTSDEVITEAAASREPRRSGYGDTGTRGQDPHIQISTTFGAVTKSRNRNLVDSVQAHLNWNRNGQLPSERPGAQGSRRPGPTAITHMPSPPPVETESGPRPSLLLRLSDVFTGDDPGTVDEDSGIHDIMSEPISKLDSTPRPRQPIHSERMTEKLEEPGPVSTGASPFFSADSVVAIDTSTSSKPNTDNPHDRLTQLRDQLRSARSSSQGILGQPSFDEQLRNGHSSSNESHLDRNTGLIPSPSFSQAPLNHGVMNDGRSHVGLSAPPAEPVDHVTDMDLQDSNGQTGITERDPRNTLLRKLDQEKQKAQSGSSIPTVSSTPVVDANAMEARLRTRARLKARLASEKRSGAAADSSKG